jgi:predicted Ser/Thr protein kinase/tetratricopeptide (TPR) repeat protein
MIEPKNTLDFSDHLERRMAGQSVESPTSWQQELDLAVAGHAALQELLADTIGQGDTVTERRTPPSLDDEFEIQRELGAGGMGVVYLVRQKSLDRCVALKVLRSDHRQSPAQMERFLGEARHLARLRHPNIVAVHEVGQALNEPYFTMDYIEGESLAKRVSAGALSPTQAVAIWKQAATAIQFAHRQGIIHRDLKPSNVLLDKDGQAYVTDFGLARDMSGPVHLTKSGELLGTPQYMAPEQIRGQSENVGEATDVYGLGLLLYEMLCGRPAFVASSMADMLVKSLQEVAKPLRELDRRIPLDLETICFRALEKAPERRYASVAAMLEDVRRWESGEPLLAKRPGVVQKSCRWLATHWKIGLTAMITAGVMLALLWPYFDQSYENLMAMGDEEFASGQFELAARVYARAAKKASSSQLEPTIQRFARASRNITDGQTAVQLALPLLDLDAGFSLGTHDYLLAMTVAERARRSTRNYSLNDWHAVPAPALELVKTRLELALANNLNPEQKLAADELLTAVNLVISQTHLWSRTAPEYLHVLPSGTVEELRSMMDDSTQPDWNRAKAALALGKKLEEQGQPQVAIPIYQQALIHFQKVYPMLSGVTAARGSKISRVGAPDAEETSLLRDLVSRLQRLAPQQPIESGLIEFSVTGFQLDQNIGLDLVLELIDPSVNNPDEGLSHNLPRLVPLRQDAPVSVQVLAGTYKLRAVSHHSRWDDSFAAVARRLEIDIDDWPELIKVGTASVTLPPIQLRLAEPMELLEPSGDLIKLPHAVFRWREIPSAVRYNLVFQTISDTPHSIVNYFMGIEVQAAELELMNLSDRQKSQIREQLKVGITGGWSVDAYDSLGRRVGKTLDASRFVVAEELAP